VVGTGTVSVSVTDFSLDSPVTASFDPSDTDIQEVQTDDPTAEIDIQRDFTNTSANPITVNEVGIVANCETDSTGEQLFLIVRDVIESTTVGVNETASLEYTITITA
jgi:hypothetical protein